MTTQANRTAAEIQASRMSDWQSVDTAPEHTVVHVKIDDSKGCRNECMLKRQGGLWFYPDNSMYVYWRPTHWRPVSKEENAARVQKRIAEIEEDLHCAKYELDEIMETDDND